MRACFYHVRVTLSPYRALISLFEKNQKLAREMKRKISSSSLTSVGFMPYNARTSCLHHTVARFTIHVISVAAVFLKGGKEPNLVATQSVEGLHLMPSVRNVMSESSSKQWLLMLMKILRMSCLKTSISA